MSTRIVILGGGTGGTLAANRLQRHYRNADVDITVIDQDDQHVYQPGLLFVPFGLSEPDTLVRSRPAQLRRGIVFVRGEIERVDVDRRTVVLTDGCEFEYEVLVVATGAQLALDETEGLAGDGWGESVHSFYTLETAAALGDALRSFDGGRLVVNVVDMPIKCPVAPLEFCFLADAWCRQRSIRDRVSITYVTPLDSAFTKPVAARALASLLESKDIDLVTEFNTGEVIGGGDRKLVGYDGREVPFDLAVVVPLHSGAAYVSRSDGLGDELGFVPVDPATMQSLISPNIFVIGDAAALPTSKAGSVAHFSGEVMVHNIERFIAGRPLDAHFDGHANCFVETGADRALLIDFNYDTEPLPGHFPSRLGLPLLKESRANHIGKRLFQPVYWHALLPGRRIPWIGPNMPHRGKRLADPTTSRPDKETVR